MSPSDSKAPAESLGFPSLDDSPLWGDDKVIPAAVKELQTPPLETLRVQHPRIAKAIEAMWGHPELDDYLDKLVVDDREGRAGFAPEVMAALLRLSGNHAKQFNFAKDKSKPGIW